MTTTPPTEHPSGQDEPPDIRHALRVLAELLDEIHQLLDDPRTRSAMGHRALVRRIRAHAAVLDRVRRNLR